MQATNWAFEQAPKDGSVIVAIYNSVLPEPLYGNPAARYDPRKFEYVGSISKQQNVCGTWHTHPVKTLEQAKSQQVIVTASGTASDSAILPRILNAVLGTKFKVVLGYPHAAGAARDRKRRSGWRLRMVLVDDSRPRRRNGPGSGCSIFLRRPAPSGKPTCRTCRSSTNW